MVQRLGRLEEDVHGLRGALGDQREVLDSMAYDFSRFTTWTVIGLLQMMDQAGVKYTSYLDYHILYGLAAKEIDKVGEVSIIWNPMCVVVMLIVPTSRRKDLSRAGPTSGIRAWREPLLKKLYFHFTMTSQNPSQTYPMPSPSVSSFTFPSTTEPVFSASTSEPVFESPNHTQPSQTTQSQQLQQYHTTTVSNNNAKFPYLKKEEYETWAMKMEYWIMNSDHNLWNIVLNGNSRKRTGRDPKGNIMILPPVSVEEHIAVQRETKARTILLQSLPEDHMADFHHLDDARDIWLAVKARFGGNEESKKMRKSMLKQEFSDFKVTESEGLHKGYDRFQKILSQLNQMQAKPDNEDCNMKFLQKHFSSTFLVIAFVNAASTNSKMPYPDQSHSTTFTTASSIPAASSNITYEDFDQIGKMDLEELDIKWQMAMLSVRINRFEKKAGRKMKFNNKDAARFDKGKVKCYKCSELGHFARECTGKQVDSKARYSSFKLQELNKGEETKALLSVDSMVNWSDHEGEDVEIGAAQVYGMIAGAEEDATGDVADDVSNVQAYKSTLQTLEQQKGWYQSNQLALEERIRILTANLENTTNMLKYTKKLNEKAKLDNLNDKVKLEEYFGLGFGDYILESDEVFDLSAPSIFDSSPKDVAEKPLHDRFVKTVGMHAVPPPLTGTFMPPSNNPDLDETQFTYGVQNCDFYEKQLEMNNKPMWTNVANIPSFVPKAASVPASSRNRQTYVPAGSRNRPTSVPAGRPFSAGGSPNSKKAQSLLFHICLDHPTERYVTCFRQKASLEESTKWHRRMAHVNFKNMNKLAKHGLLLHMDLFGPTSIRSIDHKYYSLVVTDDFSRFTCGDSLGLKGIRRDYSNARTPQQNGVAERKNRTLIEAARTMLADSMLPTMFWTEAVSTACYVLNRVLVTKPHNKTPYELVSGKVPNISHLKPFGCLVTILNTSDHLGKFEGKADEGFIVGYAAHSKAYRVYNLSSKKIEETLNLRYLEEKPNVQGLGHEWYFDLDYLTDSLGYTRFKTNQPAGTQDTNIHAGTQADSDSECDEQVIVVPSFPSNSFSGTKVNEASDMVESSSDYAEELARLQKQAYEANATAEKHLSQADNVNQCRNRFLLILPIPLSHIHKGGHTTTILTLAFSLPLHMMMILVILGDLTSPVQTRGTLQKSKFGASAFVSYVHAQQRNNHTDYLHCLFACFLSQLEPSSVAQALNDPAWIEAMQEEMQQFVNQEVWKLVPLPVGKIAIGTKWILKNKRDARGIVVRNKASIASYMGFMVYQMMSEVLVLYGGTIEEEVYVTQPKGFEDPHFPKHVYRVVKALYGLHQAPRACQDKYVQDILKKFDMESVRPATTPFEASKPKSKDEPDDAVNVHLYRSMIGSLMYLTASRPDIQFAVSACSRHQVTPLTSNLNAVKKIFKYLKGQPKLGLWYPRDSPFVLEAYSDSDYVGSHGDRKSTTGGCQFLGRRLISWQCKKQTIVATSSTEAEYVAAANCCGQVLKIHTDANVADLLTKAFDGPRFLHLVVHIGMLNP
ncbi:putative ribonuclease H-like domain-containing protein [Tanacetum coccineum]